MKSLKRITFLAIVMVMMAVVSKTALAAPYFPKKCNLYKYDNIHSYYWEMDGVKSTGDITKLKNVTRSVADVSVKTMDGSVVIDIVPKKAGKTKVSFTAKAGDKTYKYKCTFTVKTKVNPFKSVKVGKSNFTKQFGKSSETTQKISKTLKNQKILISLKNGWRVETITAWRNSNLTKPYKTIKNGGRVNIYNDTILQFELFDSADTQACYCIYYKKR